MKFLFFFPACILFRQKTLSGNDSKNSPDCIKQFAIMVIMV